MIHTFDKGLLTAGYKQEQQKWLHIQKRWFKTLQLDCISWASWSTLPRKVDEIPSQSKLRSPGHNKQQQLLWLFQSLWRKGDKTHTHHYNSIISVLKKKVANPSKCQSLLPL